MLRCDMLSQACLCWQSTACVSGERRYLMLSHVTVKCECMCRLMSVRIQVMPNYDVAGYCVVCYKRAMRDATFRWADDSLGQAMINQVTLGYVRTWQVRLTRFML